ncbi:MAG: hypothetical protein WDN69_24880 [Aliidongia sp.]
MRVVQALHWLQDMLVNDDERARVSAALRLLFADPSHGQAIRDDLRSGLPALPIWMQEIPPRSSRSDRRGRRAPMTTAAYRQIISAPLRDRLDLFLTTANRLGTPIGNVEKDFWVCWTLNALYHERPTAGPRLLFQGRHIAVESLWSDRAFLRRHRCHRLSGRSR